MITDVKTRPPRVTWLAGLALIYGAVCYVIFLFTLIYSIGFVGDVLVPKSLDSGRSVAPPLAVLVNVALLSLFALQHSIMARPAFKRWWTRFIPRSVERSTYVLFASLALSLLYWQWLPLTTTIWNFPSAGAQFLLYAVSGVGWLIALLSTFLISHADLFGLRQVYRLWRGKGEDAPVFKTPAFYRLVRHPLMVGFLLAFWATPHMTVGHLLFCLAATGYILVGIHLEEHDLLTSFGDAYRRYQQRVRMLLPLPRRRAVPSAQTRSSGGRSASTDG